MPRQLLAAYPQHSPRYDEMFEAPFAPRPHWQPLFSQLAASSPEQMRHRLRSVQRQIHDNGVTYNVYADPQGTDRPWELDLLPLVIAADEWRQIETAIAQRADLLNRVLADVYGEQRLLREGQLPPALIYGHAGFLRPCIGMQPPGGVFLHVYAADLARSPDGRWWVFADRTQAPSGAGYALENRIVISRAFPDLFRDQRVVHLAGFFRSLQESLTGWAPGGGTRPLIVLLTPGPYNESYFEHTYLARYLGFPLVEGSDLTVRDGCVWLKTLSGLSRVHGILRRVDDDYCDPLELSVDSALGIPGLTQAARLGNVLIANALGANLLETGALYGYLPGLAEQLLDAPLAMPSVATWWCGEPRALEEALERIDTLVFKAAYPQLRLEPVFGPDLDRRGRAELAAAVRAQPHHYVAQELVQLSQAPVWDRGHPRRLAARAIGLRVFACATPEGYVVMPGGLTRVASDSEVRFLSMQRGGSSKDTWVLSEGPVSRFSMLRRAIQPQEIVRSGTNLGSRVVENLFWFGRYAERCDDAARLLRIALDRLFAQAGEQSGTEWLAVLDFCRLQSFVDGEPEAAEQELIAAVFDADRPASLAELLRQLAGVASHLRERLSLDNWRLVNGLLGQLRHAEERTPADAFALLDRAVMALMTLAGFALDGMTRDPGWRFLSLGRRLERLHFFCGALRHGLRSEGPLEWLLELADSTVTYRSRYMARPQRLPVYDLLLADPGNPRAIVFQLSGIADYIGRLADAYPPGIACPLAPLRDRLQRMDLAAALDTASGLTLLDGLLAELDQAALSLSETISARYFSHAGVTHRTVSL